MEINYTNRRKNINTKKKLKILKTNKITKITKQFLILWGKKSTNQGKN